MRLEGWGGLVVRDARFFEALLTTRPIEKKAKFRK